MINAFTLNRCPYNEEALHRAIIDRGVTMATLLPDKYRVNKPLLAQSNLEFVDSKESLIQRLPGENIVPCTSGNQPHLTWSD